MEHFLQIHPPSKKCCTYGKELRWILCRDWYPFSFHCCWVQQPEPIIKEVLVLCMFSKRNVCKLQFTFPVYFLAKTARFNPWNWDIKHIQKVLFAVFDEKLFLTCCWYIERQFNQISTCFKKWSWHETKFFQ